MTDDKPKPTSEEIRDFRLALTRIRSGAEVMTQRFAGYGMSPRFFEQLNSLDKDLAFIKKLVAKYNLEPKEEPKVEVKADAGTSNTANTNIN